MWYKCLIISFNLHEKGEQWRSTGEMGGKICVLGVKNYNFCHLIINLHKTVDLMTIFSFPRIKPTGKRSLNLSKLCFTFAGYFSLSLHLISFIKILLHLLKGEEDCWSYNGKQTWVKCVQEKLSRFRLRSLS